MEALKSPNTNLIAGVLAAFGATACCLGPLLLVTLGLGGAWVTGLQALEPLQPVFAVATLAFLGAAFHRLYIAPHQCAPEDACALPAVLKRRRMVFWMVVFVAAAMLLFPFYANWFY